MVFEESKTRKIQGHSESCFRIEGSNTEGGGEGGGGSGFSEGLCRAEDEEADEGSEKDITRDSCPRSDTEASFGTEEAESQRIL